ncbi:hypothetical protein [Nitrososphaera sp.]|uniref:hypothetical protein n=1 Tax=Nitrososphaera sp. TaxID=1971748 RepID=UPI00307E9280
MVGLKQTIFKELQNHITRSLSVLESFLSILHKEYPNARLNRHSNKLMGLKNKIQGAARPCLTADDLNILLDIKKNLIGHPKFMNKLLQYDELAVAFAKAMYVSQTVTPDPSLKTRLVEASFLDNFTKQVRMEAKKNPNSVMAVASLMLILVGGKETLHYVIRKNLEEVIKSRKLSGYDLDEILSIGSKVVRGQHFVTDVVAIRDCISHLRYEITKTGDTHTITFRWVAPTGYNFTRAFTYKEWISFFEDYFFYQRIQTWLLIINLDLVLMSTLLMKK